MPQPLIDASFTHAQREGALAAWGDGTEEGHLCRWEGMELVPGHVVFSLQVLQELCAPLPHASDPRPSQTTSRVSHP